MRKSRARAARTVTLAEAGPGKFCTASSRSISRKFPVASRTCARTESVCFLSSSISRRFSVESTRGGLAAGDALCAIGDAGDGPGRGAVSTGDGIKERNGVGVGVDVGVAVGEALGVNGGLG